MTEEFVIDGYQI